MTAWYNEIDPKAAAWLRELIARGLIADGVVDERDIRDVRPADLHGFTQCHFFAGIGVWSYALRRAGWPDDRPVWTGSCPCQPFSAAGKGNGFDDERHLWPAFYWLIDQQRPAIIFGEQVASKDAEPWLDLVQDDLEAVGYGVGAVPFPSAGVGAPHIRDRLYWVADAAGRGRGEQWDTAQPGSVRHSDRSEVAGFLADADDKGPQGRIERGHSSGERAAWPSGVAGGMADTQHAERRPLDVNGEDGRDGADSRRQEAHGVTGTRSEVRSMADASGPRHDQARQHAGGPSPLSARPPEHGGPGVMGDPQREGDGGWRLYGPGEGDEAPGAGASTEPVGTGALRRNDTAGPTNGLWRDADWLLCRDGKWRPVEPGTFPLAHGAPARVGRLRGYGNAINAEAAIAFIEASGLT